MEAFEYLRTTNVSDAIGRVTSDPSASYAGGTTQMVSCETVSSPSGYWSTLLGCRFAAGTKRIDEGRVVPQQRRRCAKQEGEGHNGSCFSTQDLGTVSFEIDRLEA